MLFLVATNVVASRLPERRPTGTPHACANCCSWGCTDRIKFVWVTLGPVHLYKDVRVCQMFGWTFVKVTLSMLPTKGLGAAVKRGHHLRMVTIIHLSSGSTQSAVNIETIFQTH